MSDKICLVPSMNSNSNIWMYCNYARMAPYEERCLNCENDKCKHQGEHTIITRPRRN